MKAVVCRFEGTSREYTFLLDPKLSVSAGDQVLVEAAGRVNLVTVSRVLDEAPKLATKWAFHRVDPSRLEALKEWHLRHDQVEQARRSLKARLNKKLLEKSDMERYAELAQGDPEAQVLLAELANLKEEELAP